MKEALLFVVGNCQAHALAAMLAARGAGTICILHEVYGFRPTYRGIQPFVLPMDQAPAMADRFVRYGRPVILIEQISPITKPLPPDYLPGTARVHFPHVQLQAWWPQAAEEADLARIRRWWDLDLAGIRRSEAVAGLDGLVSDHIEQHAALRPIFSIPVHPDGEIIELLYAIITEKVGQLAEVESLIRVERGADLLNFYSDHPLHPRVIEALGLQWCIAPWYQAWTAAISAYRNNDLLRSLAIYEELLQQEGVDQHIWGNFADTMLAMKDKEGAHRAYGIAHRAFPHNERYAQSWIQTLSMAPLSIEEEPLLQAIRSIYQPDARSA